MFEPGKAPRPPSGQEQRSVGDRRKTSERREEIRYEPNKAQRRNGRDRRKHDAWDGRTLR